MMGWLTSLEGSAFSMWIRESGSPWAYPAILTAHTFGLMVLTGASAAIDMRILGIGRRIPLGSLRVMFPLIWAAFFLNLATGTLLFCAEAVTKGTTGMFFAKMVFVTIGVITVARLKREISSRSAEASTVTDTMRRLAMVSLVVWIAAITAGRLLAYVK